MYKLSIKALLTLILGLYILLICLIPLKLYKLGLVNMFGEIFPAVDLVVIYYFSTYTTIRPCILFIIGIIIDQIYQVPVGLNSFAFITINLILNYTSRWFILKDEITNILIFCAYSLLLIGFRYIIFLAKNNYGFEGFSIYFYYLTTIFSYPILRCLIHKPFTALTRYAG